MSRMLWFLCSFVVGTLVAGCGRPAVPGEMVQVGGVAALVGEAGVGSGGVNRPEHQAKPYVVVVSFDGFRNDYLDRVEVPNFRRVAEGGVRGEGLIPVFPSKTFPNHYSIATGMYAEEHGLVDNNFYDPVFNATYRMHDAGTVREARWYGGEPIWATAERQGMVTGVYFWVGSEAPIGGVLPSFSRSYSSRVANSARVRGALEWLRLPPEQRPHLVMLYISTVDAAGHRHGPNSGEVGAAVQKADRVLGELLDGIAALPFADEVNLIVVSDHGMSEIERGRAEYLDDLVSLQGVRGINSGPYMTLWVGDSVRADSIRDRLNAGLRSARAYRRYEIPERFRYRGSERAGDILVLAEPGHQVVRRGGPRPQRGGAHGYDPASPEMHGIFLATGPAFEVGARVPTFENVHIYPLIAEILGLTPHPEVSGRLEKVQQMLRSDR